MRDAALTIPLLLTQRLDAEGSTNLEANKKARAEWLSTQPVEVIFLANKARSRLYKNDAKTGRKNLFQDDRLPPKKINAFARFIKEEAAGSGGSSTGLVKELAEKWRGMRDGEKKQYEDAANSVGGDYAEKSRELFEKGLEYWQAQGVQAKKAFVKPKASKKEVPAPE